MSDFYYSFPSISGRQAGKPYFVSMCPLRLIPKIFLFDEDELNPELRAQRTLNRARIPEISRYILNNRSDYVFSAITASIDGSAVFESTAPSSEALSQLGLLKVDMAAQFIINDGQHRRAAIEQALKEDPSLGEETIAVVFFLDQGLGRSQQMFADLNRHAIRPAKSLGLLYDQRSDSAKIGKMVALTCAPLKGLVEFERTSLAERSRKLFTLSSLTSATSDLLVSSELKSVDEAVRLASEFWAVLFESIQEWKAVRLTKMSSGEIRKDFVHSHGVVVQAFGRLGAALLALQGGNKNFRFLSELSKIDFQRANARDWEGRVMVGGRMSKTTNSIVLATTLLKSRLNLELSPEEKRVETAFKASKKGH